jgi:hypothetical protein
MSSMRPVLVFSALLALPALAGETPAPAATPSAPEKKDTSKADPGAAGASNMLVTKDAVTGKLRPATPAEREKLLGRRPLVSPAPEIVTLPDGTLMLKERPEDANYAVAKRNADGTLSTSCVHGADAARDAVASTPAPAPTPTPAPKSADR